MVFDCLARRDLSHSNIIFRHDVGMHVVGQPARDLCRHFVQRWNYLLRIKNHSRTMPFLLPPPDFKLHDLEDQGLTGTCEMQICRSAGPWSMGTPYKTESSIQNAYLKGNYNSFCQLDHV